MWIVKIILTLVCLSGFFVVAYRLMVERSLDIRAESPTPSVVEVANSPLPTQSPTIEAPSPLPSVRVSPLPSSVAPTPRASIPASQRPRHDDAREEDDD